MPASPSGVRDSDEATVLLDSAVAVLLAGRDDLHGLAELVQLSLSASASMVPVTFTVTLSASIMTSTTPGGIPRCSKSTKAAPLILEDAADAGRAVHLDLERHLLVGLGLLFVTAASLLFIRLLLLLGRPGAGGDDLHGLLGPGLDALLELCRVRRAGHNQIACHNVRRHTCDRTVKLTVRNGRKLKDRSNHATKHDDGL
ncbi:hypothetical protein EJB05_49404, partial [Eragrostis curvula]